MRLEGESDTKFINYLEATPCRISVLPHVKRGVTRLHEKTSSSFQLLGHEGGTCKSYHGATLPAVTPSPADLAAHQQLHRGMFSFVVSCPRRTVNLLTTPSYRQGGTQALCALSQEGKGSVNTNCSIQLHYSHRTCATVPL